MTRKLQQSSEGPRFPFSVVEPALARTLGYPPGRAPALRARIRYLQRFLGPTAAKGVRINYGEEDVVRLLIALRVQEHGVDPRIAAELVRDHWKMIGHWVRKVDEPGEIHPERSYNPIYLSLRLRIGSGAHDKDKIASVGGFPRYEYLKDAQRPRVEREAVSLFLDRMDIGEEHELGGLILNNLTALITRLRSHLGDERSGAREIGDAGREQRQ